MRDIPTTAFGIPNPFSENIDDLVPDGVEEWLKRHGFPNMPDILYNGNNDIVDCDKDCDGEKCCRLNVDGKIQPEGTWGMAVDLTVAGKGAVSLNIKFDSKPDSVVRVVHKCRPPAECGDDYVEISSTFVFDWSISGSATKGLVKVSIGGRTSLNFDTTIFCRHCDQKALPRVILGSPQGSGVDGLPLVK